VRTSNQRRISVSRVVRKTIRRRVRVALREALQSVGRWPYLFTLDAQHRTRHRAVHPFSSAYAEAGATFRDVHVGRTHSLTTMCIVAPAGLSPSEGCVTVTLGPKAYSWSRSAREPQRAAPYENTSGAGVLKNAPTKRTASSPSGTTIAAACIGCSCPRSASTMIVPTYRTFSSIAVSMTVR
jgi:hypothetical protein